MDRRYVGIDLHRRRSVIYAMDAEGTKLLCERIDNDALRLLEVVSAVGDIPNTEWLVGSGIPISSGVVVDGHCRVSPQIVAAGDVTVMARNDGGLLRMPSWTNAIEQGRAAALSLLHADDAPLYRPSQYFWTEQFDLDIKVVGQLEPQGPPAVLDGSLESGPALLAWPTAANPHTVIAVDHHTPPAKLKRLLHKRSVLASA